MNLKLFSGASWSQAFLDDLSVLLRLDDDTIRLLIMSAVKLAREGRRAITSDELQQRLKADSDQVSTFMSLIGTIAPRVLAGKSGSDVIDDFASHGLPKERIAFLFSAIEGLQEDDKRELRFWGVARQVERNHFHSVETDVSMQSLVDEGFLVGVVPFSTIRIAAKLSDKEEEQIWELEFTVRDLEDFISIFKDAKKELEATTQLFREKLDTAFVTVGGK